MRQFMTFLFTLFCILSGCAGSRNNETKQSNLKESKLPPQVKIVEDLNKVSRFQFGPEAGYGKFFMTLRQFKNGLEKSGLFLKSGNDIISVDTSDNENSDESENAIITAARGKARNFTVKAEQICKPEEGDYVSHCSSRLINIIKDNINGDVLIVLKNVKYPYFPDFSAFGDKIKLHIEHEIGLNHLNINPLFLNKLKDSANIVSLEIPLTSEALSIASKILPTIKNLKKLSIAIAKTVNGDLSFLKECKKLKSLSLFPGPDSEISIKKENFSFLRDLPQLEDFYLSHNDGLHIIGFLNKGISSVSLEIKNITSSNNLYSLTKLKKLKLKFESSSTDLNKVCELKNLESISLSGSELTSSIFKNLLKCKKLKSLYLDFHSYPDDFSFSSLSVLKLLQKLTLLKFSFNPENELNNFKSLKYLKMNVTSESNLIETLSKKFPHIQFVND